MKMGLRRWIVIFVSALLLCVSQPFWLSYPLLVGSSVVVGQTNDSRKAEAYSLLKQGSQQHDKRQFEAALHSFQKALAIYREIRDIQGQDWSLMGITLIYQDTKQYGKLIENSQQWFGVKKDPQGKIRVLNNLSYAHEAIGDYHKEIYYYKESLALAGKIHDSQKELNALLKIAGSYNFNLQQYEKAIEYWQKSLKIIHKNPNSELEITILRGLFEAHKNLGNYTKVVEYAQQALLKIQQMNTDKEYKELEANIFLILGETYGYLKDYDKAFDSYQKSRIIARKIHNTEIEKEASFFLPPEPFLSNPRINESIFLYLLGQRQSQLGKYKEALKNFQKVLVINRELNQYLNEGYTLEKIGQVYYREGKEQYPKALDFYEKALAIAKQIPDQKLEVTVINSMGEVYIEQAYYNKAERAFKQALKILRQLTVTDKGLEAIILNNLGNLYGKQDEYSKSLLFYQQALDIRKKLDYKSRAGSTLWSIAEIHDKNKNYSKALEAYQEALAFFEKNNDTNGKSMTRVLMGITLTNIGTLNYIQKQYTNAEKYLFDAITNWESLRQQFLHNDARKLAFIETSVFTYRLLQAVLIAQNKTDAALEVAERGRARTLIELILSNQSSQKFNIENIKIPRLDEIQKLAQAQKATVVYYSQIQDNRRYEVNPSTQFIENNLYIWVIKPTGEIKFKPVDLKPILQKENTTLEELVDNIRDSIGVRDRSIFTRTNSIPQNTTTKRDQFDIKVFPSPDDDPSKDLQKLHEILIDPIAKLLPTDPNERVIFIPQNELFLVPFPALKDAQGKYLIEKHTILTAPSIQVLGLTHQREEEVKLASVQNALVVGNPDMPSVAPKIGDEPQPLSKLPEAEKEAKAITPLLKENKLKTKLLTDKQATKAAVLELLPQAKIIHLATHGLFDNIEGLQSAIALAPSAKDNGLLTAEEILNLKLNADLVVLSACNTGRGRITGDGVIGLSRSLISAGTPSVIVSLWAVPDAPTSELMTEFYKNLLDKQKPLDKAQALRQAMLKFKDKPPKDWAAFTLIGESNQVTN